MLAQNGNNAALSDYFEVLNNPMGYVEEISTRSDHIQTILSTDPTDVYTAMKANSWATDVLDQAITGTSTMSFATLTSSLFDGPLEGKTEIALLSILNKEKYFLAEHHLYGSSRLGIKNYWPSHYNFTFDQDGGVSNPNWATALADNELLSKHRPWYSNAYNSLIRANKTEPWDNDNNDQVISSRVLGQKDYELTNHLGNVMAVVLDKVVEKEEPSTTTYNPTTSATLSSPTTATQLATLRASYDYYPFGMLMPHRYHEDNTIACAPVTTTEYTTSWVPVEMFEFLNQQALNHFSSTQGTTLNIDPHENELRVIAPSTMDMVEVSKSVVGVQASKEMTVEFSFRNNGRYLVDISLQQMDDNNEWRSIASTSVAFEENVSLTGMALNSNAMRLVFNTIHGADMHIGVISTIRHDILASTVTKLICNKDPFFDEDYRFGFNGQEKVNEIAGIRKS
jgi:hypothetical protein